MTDSFKTELGNYYGTVRCWIEDGQPMIGLENWDGQEYPSPISRELFDLLRKELGVRCPVNAECAA